MAYEDTKSVRNLIEEIQSGKYSSTELIKLVFEYERKEIDRVVLNKLAFILKKLYRNNIETLEMDVTKAEVMSLGYELSRVEQVHLLRAVLGVLKKEERKYIIEKLSGKIVPYERT